jgi:hypothetical protein
MVGYQGILHSVCKMYTGFAQKESKVKHGEESRV